MALGEAVRRFGPPIGAPGIEVLEKPGTNALTDPRYGAVFMLGVTKRGPMGVPIPVRSRRQYDEIFGDPRDPRWHLYPNGAHMLPDAIDGFFSNGGGSGVAYVLRLDLDGKARKSSLVLKSRRGDDVLRVTAANEGRWAGPRNKIPATPVVVATARTFTLVKPGVEANEFTEAIAEFTGAPGKRYTVVANTAASPLSGEVVFTVGAQFDLILDGVSGPVALTGTAEYQRYPSVTGSVSFPLYRSVTGTANINGTVVTGVGTDFLNELEVGNNIYFQDEARSIQSITSATTLTVTDPFTNNVTGVAIQRDNTVVTGNATTFLSELKVGDTVYALFNGERHSRTIASVETDTALTLTSGWNSPLSAGSSIQRDGFLVTGTATNFASEVTLGQYLVDPNRQGSTVKVVEILDATTIRIEQPFTSSFSAVQLTKQGQLGLVNLEAPDSVGLSIEIGQGTRLPQTHFSMTVRFNGSMVMSIADASLDPNDPEGLFVDSLVNNSNIAIQQGSHSHTKWIECETLWSSAYTTSPGSDVRPCNGAGEILAIEKEKAYTITDMDYARCVGSLFYPNPYAYPRGYFRAKKAQAPLNLEGTISSNGAVVNGTGTTFTRSLKKGDYIYDPNTNTVRKVISVISDTQINIAAPFPQNVPALTASKRSGFVQVDQSYDIGQLASVGHYFLSVYPQNLENGYDGDTSSILPYYLSKYADADLNIIENAVWGKNVGLLRIAAPGISDVTVQRAFASYASQKAFEFRAEIPSFYNSAATAEAWVNNVLGRNDFQTVAFPSYAFIANPLGSGNRFVSISGDILGGESERANVVEGYHFPFSGMKATLPRVLRLPFEAFPVDEAILNTAGIQPIKFMQGNAVVWGARGPASSPTYDFIHIRRIQSNYVRVFLEARTLLDLMFRPTQPQLIDEVVMIMNNFARKEYRKGVMSNQLTFSQAVEIGTSGNSSRTVSDQSSSDAIVALVNGKLEVYFRFVPTGVLERLSIQSGPDILVAQYGNVLNTASAI